MLVLALETSCDDTAVAILTDEPRLLYSRVLTQDQIHQQFGGIVPENASRAHLEVLDRMVAEAIVQTGLKLEELDAIVATRAPGLLGSLLVGATYAKSLAAALGKPCLGVHHVEGHLAAPLMAARLEKKDVAFPALALVVSGGHTHLYSIEEWGQFRCLGRTRDDAVGECFDKGARLLGLPYPGGPPLNRLAEERLKQLGVSASETWPLKGRSSFSLPRPKPGLRFDENLDFSFSGLKTAIRILAQETGVPPEALPDAALAIHEAIGEVLVRKLTVALDQNPTVKSLWLTGGVACNSLLRAWLTRLCTERGVEFLVAPREWCTDNAAMIGYAGCLRWNAEGEGNADFEVEASAEVLPFHDGPPQS